MNCLGNLARKHFALISLEIIPVTSLDFFLRIPPSIETGIWMQSYLSTSVISIDMRGFCRPHCEKFCVKKHNIMHIVAKYEFSSFQNTPLSKWTISAKNRVRKQFRYLFRTFSNASFRFYFLLQFNNEYL